MPYALEAWSLNHWATRELWSPPLPLFFPPSSRNFTPNSFEFRLRWYPLKVRRRLSFPLSPQTLVILEKEMAEGIEAAGSNTEAVSPSSVPRDEENSDICKGQGMPKPGLWLPVFPSGQQRVVELTQRSEGL